MFTQFMRWNQDYNMKKKQVGPMSPTCKIPIQFDMNLVHAKFLAHVLKPETKVEFLFFFFFPITHELIVVLNSSSFGFLVLHKFILVFLHIVELSYFVNVDAGCKGKGIPFSEKLF